MRLNLSLVKTNKRGISKRSPKFSANKYTAIALLSPFAAI